MDALVARILSATDIVLNVGSDDGVRTGQEFLIYELGEEICDPITKESLGQLEIQKGRVTVLAVQAKMCTAQTGKRTHQKTEIMDPYRSVTSIFGATRTYDVTVQEKLKVLQPGSDYEQRLYVRVGDRARSIGIE